MVSKEEGEAVAVQYDLKYFETSCLENWGVEEAFTTCATDAVRRLLGDGGGGGGGGGGGTVSAQQLAARNIQDRGGNGGVNTKGCC